MTAEYIAIEGGDGSGKSTVASAVEKRLIDLGRETMIVREPGSTGLGESIRELLLDGDDMHPWAEAFLFAAQRAQLAAEVVAPALAEGIWVISDRTYFSSIAYQGGGRGLGMDTVRQVNEHGLDGVVPDHVFVLDVDVSVALNRQDRPDRIGGEDEEFHQRVRDAYRKLSEQDPERVVIIDNTLGLEEVVTRIMSHLP
ncbi:MAG: dTMP kinase [Actinobacteria bacterium]|nr:MAG: dTMP kinase [Actinomycetota bacterium]